MYGWFSSGPADDLKYNFKPSADDLLMSIDNGNDALMLGSFDSGMLSYLDPLAEASLDSFVDLSTFLEEVSFTGVRRITCFVLE